MSADYTPEEVTLSSRPRFKIFFLCGPFFKVFIEFVTILFLFYVSFWFFGQEAGGISAPRLGIKPASPALGGEVSATGTREGPLASSQGRGRSSTASPQGRAPLGQLPPLPHPGCPLRPHSSPSP